MNYIKFFRKNPLFFTVFSIFFRLFSYIIHTRIIHTRNACILPKVESMVFRRKSLPGKRTLSPAVHRRFFRRIIRGGSSAVCSAAGPFVPRFFHTLLRRIFLLCIIFSSPLLYSFLVTCPVFYCDIYVISLTKFLQFAFLAHFVLKTLCKLIFQLFSALLLFIPLLV